MKPLPLVERIQRNSEPAGDCWEWQGQKAHGLTPIIRYRHAGEWTSLPVRRAILLERGVDMDGKRAVFTCRNKSCVRPEHVGVMG